MTLNSFGCLWLTDESNRLYYSNDINFYSPQIEAEFNEVKHSLFSTIKDIFAANERLYLITRENKIYIKDRIFDISTLKCNGGDVILDFTQDIIYKEGFSVSSEVDSFHRIRENYNNNIYALDRRGRVLYRKDKNEFNPEGTDWKELEFYKDVKDDIDRINDIYVDNKDLYLMDANGAVICYEDINRPRLSDI